MCHSQKNEIIFKARQDRVAGVALNLTGSLSRYSTYTMFSSSKRLKGVHMIGENDKNQRGTPLIRFSSLDPSTAGEYFLPEKLEG